jgi:hypothetical protein
LGPRIITAPHAHRPGPLQQVVESLGDLVAVAIRRSISLAPLDPDQGRAPAAAFACGMTRDTLWLSLWYCWVVILVSALAYFLFELIA